MPWRDRFNQIKNEVNGMIGSQQQQQPPQQYYQQPPPVPANYPGNYQQGGGPPPPVPPHPDQQQAGAGGPPPIPPHPPQASRVYWQPQFQGHVEIAHEWDAKTGHGTDGWGNHELQNYTDQSHNAFHTPDGRLVLRAIANNGAGEDQKYTSARLVSKQTLAQDRGVLSAVILSPCAEGIWPAFWLLPKEPFSWPTDGEIDIAETWNGDCENHTCLHWGQHDQPDKHRVLGTRIPDMAQRPVQYDFAWDQPGGQAGQGRMLWYIDGRPVMKATVPEGTRPLRDMTILFNVAMGGNVCQGKVPRDGAYDMVVFALSMAHEMENGGWGRFEYDWNHPGVPQGNTY